MTSSMVPTAPIRSTRMAIQTICTTPATSEGGDTVNNFTTGTDDFVFLQSAFDNLYTGTLDASNFSIIGVSYNNNGTSTAATGGTAGFIFSTFDSRLTYDADGNGVGAGFTIATLSSGSVSAGDVEITVTSPL